MQKRQTKILDCFIDAPNRFHSINDLKKIADCSEKTVRNDLDKIERYLLRFPDVLLIRTRGKGIMLQGEDKAILTIYLALHRIPTISEEEKHIEMAYLLLTSKTAITQQYFIDKYFVHAAIIKNDLEVINQWFLKFHLKIISVRGKGTFVEGNEFNKRKAIAHLSELLDNTTAKEKVLHFFEPSEVHIVQSALRQMKHHFRLTMNDASFDSLVMHGLIMIKRTKQQHKIEIPEDQLKEADTLVYEMTTYILDYIRGKMNITFPKEEKVYYSWHVASVMQQNKATSSQDFPISDQTKKITNQLIDKMEALTFLPFKEDASLEDSVAVHMEAALTRLKYGFHISNPMLHDIKRLYPYMLSMVVFALHEIAEENKYNIPEEEAAYLVLHFQATIERMKNRRAKQRALVVCHMGIGMSRLLEAKLKQQYKGLTIVDSIAMEQLMHMSEGELAEIDFIISTEPIEKQIIPHLVITPLLSNKDKKVLHQFMEKKEEPDAPKAYKQLKELLADALFQRDIALDHPFKIIERLASQLVRLDFVEAAFIHGTLKRERASFTAIGGKIAIPHTEPATVKRTSLSIGILKNPVIWGHEQVSVVFMLAINEQDRNITRELLAEISHLTADPQKVEQIMKCKNKQDMRAVFE